MGGNAAGPPASPPGSTAGATFTLERFEWATPDLLEIAGRFANVPEDALAEPVLVVRGGDRTDRLAPVADSGLQPGRGLRRFGGTRWRASFAWPGTPSSFDRAALELGEELVVALPTPGVQLGGRRELRVSRRETTTVSAAERIGLHAELAAAREEAERLRAKLHDAQQFARRLRQDLEAQRKRRDAEAKRFQEALSGVRGTAEEAVTLERRTAEGLRAALEEAQKAAADAQRDLGTLREELVAARDASAAHERLQVELDQQRLLVAEAGEERKRALAERDGAVAQLADVRAVVDGLARAEGQLGAQIQRLQAQLSDRTEEETSRSAAAPEP
jgi:hypothetical protein